MVDINASNKDEAEALRDWWKENGRSVVTGVILGVAGIVGWQQWTSYEQARAEAASAQFQLLASAVDRKDSAQAEQRAESLMVEFKATPYASLAGLMIAKLKAENGDLVGAQPNLQFAIDNAPDSAIEALARARLVRVRIAAGDLAGAKAGMPEPAPPGFIAEFAELRGDIAVAEGRAADARTAYAEALANMPIEDSRRFIVEMKRDNVGAPPG
ncbi:MAG: tetratricopeptide repeat protein [Gammaproteobacteria bacterium]|nr:tetratricopeptide repeat protein [Gammaproteobacteria bacterium]